jgi:hypothetical protein
VSDTVHEIVRWRMIAALERGTRGLSATDPSRYAWEAVAPGDLDHMPPAQILLHVVADRQRWHAALTEARHRAAGEPGRLVQVTLLGAA